MLVSDFNYDLPEERIAKFPPKVRGTTRLLAINRKTGELTDSYYRNLDEFLNPGDVLILNNTKVMHSRLFCHLPDGRERELVVLERHADEPLNVLYRGKLHDGDILTVNDSDEKVKVVKVLGNGIAEVESETPLETLAEKYGDVFIVSGPILFRQQHQTIGANKVVVPEAFFKVIVCLNGSTPKGIGFICRNTNGRGKKDLFVNSIREVERVTGMTFFPKLPKNLQNVVKNKASLKDW